MTSLCRRLVLVGSLRVRLPQARSDSDQNEGCRSDYSLCRTVHQLPPKKLSHGVTFSHGHYLDSRCDIQAPETPAYFFGCSHSKFAASFARVPGEGCRAAQQQRERDSRPGRPFFHLCFPESQLLRSPTTFSMKAA